MKGINHKFRDHKIQPDTQFLIIGTFNPEAVGNNAEFFYGRPRNYLWRLLPICFGYEDLREKSVGEKHQFIKKVKVDFTDLIESVTIEEVDKDNYKVSDIYKDAFIDKRISRWNDVISLLENHKTIKKVCFTRISFGDIPNMKKRITEINEYCQSHEIQFQCLETPARFYSDSKQFEWKRFFID